MLYRIVNKIKTNFIKHQFFKLASAVKDTAPIDDLDTTANVIVLSMVQKKDIDMYLLAVKSFLSYIKVKKVVVIADTSIDEFDEKILSEHIPKIEVKKAENFRHSDIPVGGTWERLYAISAYLKDAYVIQLDADTLTLQEPTEVIDSIKNNQPFVLGTHQGQVLKSLQEASNFAEKHITSDNPHVQLAAEAALTHVDLPFHSYVRGCSGFTGFASDSIEPRDVEALSKEFYKVLGKKWEEWGSEQFASNLLLANQSNLMILPIKKYLTPLNTDFTGQCFLHFIGSMRFANHIYIKAAEIVLKQLRKK